MNTLHKTRLSCIQHILTWLLCLCIGSQALAWNTPHLGDPSIHALSPLQEKKYGKLFIKTLKQRGILTHDLILAEYIENLGKKIAAYSDGPSCHFKFFVVNDSSVNAFAGPDGYIGINTGLIAYTHSQDELAGVIAHEIAHVTQRHLARAIAASHQRILPTIALIVAGILAANPEATTGAITTAAAGNAQAFINHTRAQEKEADRIAINTLIKAGFNPLGMATLFRRMQEDSFGKKDASLKFLKTHPSYDTRIADIKNRATTYSHQTVDNNLRFHLIQARILSGTLKNNDARSHANPIIRYTYALQLARKKTYAPAIHDMHVLLKADPHNDIYLLTLASLQEASGYYHAAIKTLLKAKLLYATRYPFVMQYGNVLLKAKKSKAASNFLKKQYAKLKDDTPYLFLYARALGETKKYTEAYQMRARAFSTEDNINMAIAQLEQAQKQTGQSDYTKESLRANIEALKKQLAQKNK